MHVTMGVRMTIGGFPVGVGDIMLVGVGVSDGLAVVGVGVVVGVSVGVVVGVFVGV